MEKCIKQFVFWLLLFAAAMVTGACSEADDEKEGINPPEGVIEPHGGVLTLFDGNITLAFPENAVSSEVHFTVNLCMDDKDCNYLLQPFRIEPLMLFNKPVSVTLRYDGILALPDKEIQENICLMAKLWKSEADLLNNQPCTTCLCAVNYEQKTLTFCICNSGIITIGLPD